MGEAMIMPYVGISGIVRADEQHELTEIFRLSGLPNAHRQLLLGVKATHKTQWEDAENKYGPVWYPVGGAFSHALHRTGDGLNVAQLFLEPSELHDEQYRRFFVSKALGRGASWLNGVQFDMLPWHKDPTLLGDLQRLKAERPDLTVLLQCHKSAMDLGPDGAVRILERYADGFDYVLFDASHGKGERLDTNKLCNFLDASYASTALTGIGKVVAGGLNGNVVQVELPPLINKYPELSWDAEGQLHPARPDKTRPLSMDMAEDYLLASARVLM